MRKIKRYGWKRDLPDHRDYRLVRFLPLLPALVDLRPQCPPVYDQGELGSCTANAIAAAVEFDLMKQTVAPVFSPSRLFIYFNEREIEGDIDGDNGAQIRDGIKTVSKLGVTSEMEWPYLPKMFAVRPPEQAYRNAETFNVFTKDEMKYEKVDQNLGELKSCLATGSPFVFGMSVYESFESKEVAASGMVSMPGFKEKMIGGHAVMCVGYDDSKLAFIIRNSWGPAWGIGGYFYLPYAYMINPDLCDDFWTIKVVA